MKAVIIYGAPASGKSTLAQEYVKEGYMEINRDSIRFGDLFPGGDWTTYKFSKENEKRVTRFWEFKLERAVFNKQDIVISDTLCNKERRRQLVDRLEKLGYTVVTVELNVPLETLIERDSKRGGFSVGRFVIEQKVKELNDGN